MDWFIWAPASLGGFLAAAVWVLAGLATSLPVVVGLGAALGAAVYRHVDGSTTSTR
jgi:hypothetical protein